MAVKFTALQHQRNMQPHQKPKSEIFNQSTHSTRRGLKSHHDFPGLGVSTSDLQQRTAKM